jgi:oxygen-independent coproporphyrinogen-3 oxidase
MPSFTLTDDQRRIYRRYSDLALPRHTSYPISPVWRDSYGPADFRADLAVAAGSGRDLSLYVHIPFCERLCYYCACTKEIVPADKRRQRDPSDELLAGFDIESRRFGEAAGPRIARQVHFGGGSPTYLTPAQLERLWRALSRSFAIAPDAEIAIEIDPRITTRDQLTTLRGLGFNRVSLGVQDFDAHVQQTVNRIQPAEMTARVVEWCRELGFDSINFDLIYGLPFQTPETMAATLDQTVAMAPDRIAFYRLAVIPEIFKWQNTFRHADLPAGELSLELNLMAIERFQRAGYEFIGLDHFARPTEALATAARDGSLRRNFQGMTTGKSLEIIGIGPSAISQLDGAFAQNQKTSTDWRAAIEIDFATHRGLRLTDDDRLRRELMQTLYGIGVIDKRALEREFAIDFDGYFARELSRLAELVAEGLVVMSEGTIELTAPLGRLLVRVVAAVFDRYLPPTAYRDGLPAHLASRVG